VASENTSNIDEPQASSPASVDPSTEQATESLGAPDKATRSRARKAKGDSVAKATTTKAKAHAVVGHRSKSMGAGEAVTGGLAQATVVDAGGARVETIDLDPAKFAVAANINTLHLVVRASQAARRRGTASTKTRGEISGSTAKLYRQKGTGRARVGSVKSPTRVGGGIAFGPQPRGYEIKINRKVVRKALLMALSDRAGNGSLFVARDLQLDKPSTARINQFLVGLDVAAPVLLVTHDEPQIALSTRNLIYAEAAEVTTLTTEQVLRARSLVLTEKAFTALTQA
jgi:large subunit ribosomal protein L4